MSQTVSPFHPVVASPVVADELVGFRELPELLGVAPATAARYANRKDFPRPFARLASGRVWRRKDVKAWARRTLPLQMGRPRKEQ
jgi:prophage regulatory protein